MNNKNLKSTFGFEQMLRLPMEVKDFHFSCL